MGQPQKIHRVLKVHNPSKEDCLHQSFRDLWPIIKQGWYDWRQYTAMDRGRGCSEIGGGSGSVRILGIGRDSHAGRIHHDTYSK